MRGSEPIITHPHAWKKEIPSRKKEGEEEGYHEKVPRGAHFHISTVALQKQQQQGVNTKIGACLELEKKGAKKTGETYHKINR